MLEIGVILVIIIAAWFYLRKNGAAEVSSVESEEKTPATAVTREPVKKKVSASQPVAVIPEDSALKRHYLQNLAGIKASLETPFPEDSALRRHYLQNIATQQSEDNSCDEAPAVVTEDAVTEVILSKKISTPEDVVLRRHYIQQLVAKTEATMPPRPTDSTLKRHYDTQLMSSVLSQLQKQESK
ncbi:hypothetical protein bplSymb_SCF02102P017 [Bathymodiolus platifrons methanotrophic gill symbiont]|uniref:hypothetical protein n=1 Tax=Bathymodiolus platifrons methanotrophic gill symbiont TaxID=113268 RepID=UPI000B413357|nr:hypothetical protein [Bathymodiolus platifrons methanotrophic gill symbiont]MCK5870621.1 hypothetical protein [Methyloprofundus sp.]TXK97489.1 hypothetical protein BMR11_10210 [Methylococcaceae bacterium CS5]TXK97536.1 hypothetical protein BMR10_04865 [Methylococcaceae bacterium CS4]TXL04215.1 hypothetical protein BMR07_13005 [Methylococcaceae bacterium CS1]TXL05403.1 hypothetical protein BMR09_10320 [Methylococcaceae bacterium CS3]TXL10433.1 hypothetical protein BMR08_09140 [Methylococcac